MNGQSAFDKRRNKMSRKITKEVFLQRFYQRYPEAKIDVLTYDSLKKFCKIKCLICGKVYSKPRAEGFLSSWKCCEGNNESKIELIKRLCNESGEYQFIKQLDALHIVIKHLKCGNELTKSVQSAISSPCSCPICNTQSQKLRITLQDAQKQLDDAFGGSIQVLFFDGVDSKKSQFRCNQCGLIFNQSHYNLVTKCRGCPKCDQRRSKGEKAMRKWLDEHQFEYQEQIHFKELGQLSFDFGIIQNNQIIALIEVQGEQHYKEVFHYPSRPNYFKIQQLHDQQKRDFCKKQNIPLYEIVNISGKLKNLDILSDLSNSTTISVKESTL